MNPIQHCTKNLALFCDGNKRMEAKVPPNAVVIKFNLRTRAYEVQFEKDGPWHSIENREVRATETLVVNQHRLIGDWKNDPGFVYIGRPTIFGNQFRVRAADRGTGFAVKKYKASFLKRVKEDFEFARAVASLRGKCLVCFCKPNPCHGDVIKEWLDGQPIATPTPPPDMPSCPACGATMVRRGENEFRCPVCGAVVRI